VCSTQVIAVCPAFGAMVVWCIRSAERHTFVDLKCMSGGSGSGGAIGGHAEMVVGLFIDVGG